MEAILKSACLNCYPEFYDTVPKTKTLDSSKMNLCSVRHVPSKFEHCLQYALLVDFEKGFGLDTFSASNATHLQYVISKSKERAIKFNIPILK